jgi:mRNA-degrading endonuclease RelE of RelBE toxin-antitoxin system
MAAQNAQYQVAQSVEIPEHVLAALQMLSPEQRQQIFDFVEFLSQKQVAIVEESIKQPKQQRVFGQYTGRITMSDDFDEPLPDAFWLGES